VWRSCGGGRGISALSSTLPIRKKGSGPRLLEEMNGISCALSDQPRYHVGQSRKPHEENVGARSAVSTISLSVHETYYSNIMIGQSISPNPEPSQQLCSSNLSSVMQAVFY
jgi:hypothetical protein